jgi:hypothetical protein
LLTAHILLARLRTVGRARLQITRPLGHVFGNFAHAARLRGICPAARRGGSGRASAAAMTNVGPVATNLLSRAGDQRQLASFSHYLQEPRLWWVVIPARTRGGERWLCAYKHQPIFEEQCK